MLRQPALEAIRQQSNDRKLDEPMKDPQNEEGEGKSQDEDSRESMCHPSMGIEFDQIFKIGRERADDQSRGNEAPSAKRQGGGAMRESKRHTSIMPRGTCFTREKARRST